MSPTPFQTDHHIHNRSVKRENLSAITALNDDNTTTGGHPGMCPPSLKVRNESHAIKKSSSSSSSSSGAMSLLVGSGPQPHPHQRGPVIIYTHSPKVIHTHPKDFMALVQKLTGMSRSEGVGPTDSEYNSRCKKHEVRGTHMLNNYGDLHSDLKKMIKITDPHEGNNNNNNNSNIGNDDNESSSVITEENCSSSNTRDGVVGQLNSCVGSPLLDTQPVASTPGPLFPNLPFYNMAGSSEFLYCGVEQPLYDYMDVNFPYNHTN